MQGCPEPHDVTPYLCSLSSVACCRGSSICGIGGCLSVQRGGGGGSEQDAGLLEACRLWGVGVGGKADGGGWWFLNACGPNNPIMIVCMMMMINNPIPQTPRLPVPFAPANPGPLQSGAARSSAPPPLVSTFICPAPPVTGSEWWSRAQSGHQLVPGTPARSPQK